MPTILVTGANGLIAKTLISKLEEKGHEVLKLSRRKSEKPNWYYWNIDEAYIDPQAIKRADYIVHLAGTSIGKKRWSKKQKKRLLNSRVLSTNLLYHKCIEVKASLKGFIGMSGVGFYGTKTTKTIFTESDQPGNDFLARLCQKWESASLRFQTLPSRVVLLRSGLVFSKFGGAFLKLKQPITLGVGSPLGLGNQYIPWIHIDDLCAMISTAIESEKMEGIYNAVAPEHINNKELTFKLAEKLNKKIRFSNVPSLLLKLIYGERSLLLLEGSRVSAQKLENTGFKFNFPTIASTLDQLVD